MSEKYEYIRAVVGSDGDLAWRYKLLGSFEGREGFDEDVSDWSDKDIEKLTKEMLDVDADDPVVIEILRY